MESTQIHGAVNRKFTYNDRVYVTADKNEIKRMKSCGWKEIKAPKETFVKGLMGGNNFLS